METKQWKSNFNIFDLLGYIGYLTSTQACLSLAKILLIEKFMFKIKQDMLNIYFFNALFVSN